MGLCGKESTITRGLGQVDSQVSISESKNVSPGSGAPGTDPGACCPVGPSSGIWRMSAPAKSGA